MSEIVDLKLLISKKTDEELVELLSHENDYTLEAITLAKNEAMLRGLDLSLVTRPPEVISESISSDSVVLGTELAGGETWIKNFNWGALLMTPLWLMFHGKVGIGLLIMFLYWPMNAVLMLAILSENVIWIILAIFYFLSPFAVSIYFGIKGNRIAWEDRDDRTMAQIVKREEKWTIAGVIIVGLLITLSFARYFL